MLSYYEPISSKDCIITIDKIRIQFSARNCLMNSPSVDSLLPFLIFKDEDSRQFMYKYHYESSYENGKMDVFLLNNSKESSKSMIQVNPNKCFYDVNCLEDIKSILSCSSSYSIKSIDIAIDFPVLTELISILKDQRALKTYSRSKVDRTEYLGKNRNKPGCVKKYDKAKESQLSSPLTRIEITAGNPASTDFIRKLSRYLPKTYIRQSTVKSIDLNSVDLKDSERVLAMLLMDHTDKIKYYHMLGKKMQKKIEPLILSDEVEYAYDINLISQVAYKMISILDFDFAELNDGVFYVKPGCKF